MGLLIVAASSAAMFYGVVYSRAELRKVTIQERALEELNNEVEYWMARVASQGRGAQTASYTGSRGREVILFAADDDPNKAIIGTIYRLPVEEEVYEDVNKAPYYIIEAWIEWDDYLGEPGEMNEIRVRTAGFKYEK